VRPRESRRSKESRRSYEFPPSPDSRGSRAQRYAEREEQKFVLNRDDMENAERRDILTRLNIYKQRRLIVARTFTLKSDIEEMRMEVGRIELDERRKNGAKKQRRWFLGGCGVVKFVFNRKEMPASLRGSMEGLVDHMLGCIDEFETVFELAAVNHPNMLNVGSSRTFVLDMGFVFGSQMLAFLVLNKSNAKKQEIDMAAMTQKVRDEITQKQQLAQHQVQVQQEYAAAGGIGGVVADRTPPTITVTDPKQSKPVSSKPVTRKNGKAVLEIQID